MANENILATIVRHKYRELAHGDRAALPKRRRALYGFRNALLRNGTRLILECKRASPSAGILRAGKSLAPVIDAYRGVADAVSVLTDARFFNGSLDDLAYVAARVNVPVLRKDFILDPVQVHEAHAFGADAALLMLSVLDDDAWRDCAGAARRLGLDVLTEVHDDAELERALSLGAAIIGINNRSFADLSVNLDVTRRLARRVPADRVVVCESGIHDHADARALAPQVHAFLVGTSLMRAARTDLAARELAFGEVKICGLTRAADARAAWQAGARWGGLVFAPGSPRRVDVDTAHDIVRASPLPMVGVFADADPGFAAACARELGLAAVQLHGNEAAACIQATRAALPATCALWKAVREDDAMPFAADRLLFDGARPGSGVAFDWSRLPPADAMARHGLAGGIHPGNIAAARATGAGLLDVSSGVESAPGIKSPEKLAALFDAIRVAMRFPQAQQEKADASA
ncbi:MAG TPA: bifunctional indole-3-glycerol-phosphate synthase TrpC/phosphoribosylanthranilate isomerase TrpF [Gammaproteobacteria bacterium]